MQADLQFLLERSQRVMPQDSVPRIAKNFVQMEAAARALARDVPVQDDAAYVLFSVWFLVFLFFFKS